VSTRLPVRPGLFTDEPSAALLGSHCRSCGAHHFPRHDTCPYCAAEDPEPAELSDHGQLWAWTAVTAPPPGYLGDVPYGIGVVELPEGIRVIARLTESDPAALELGQPMALRIVTLHTTDDGDQVVSYAFAPTAAP
jgi:uncharacterized protein